MKPSRMLKESASVVLAPFPAAVKRETRVSHGAADLHVELRILVRRGWVGENSGSFEHPAGEGSGTCAGIALIH